MTQTITARALVILEVVIAEDDDRQTILAEQLCADEVDLHNEVLRLLACDKKAVHSEFLNQAIELNVEPLPEGTIIAGRYHLVRYIGGGGGGDVYEAEDESLGRAPVALKILNPLTAVRNDRAIARFLNEAELVARMRHPHVVPVFAAGEDHGLYYYVMQLIRGQDLAKRIAAWREHDSLSSLERIREAAEFGVKAARGLHHAHETGLIHRDIKPGNLVIDGEHNLWITDFGLAQLRDRQADVTASVGACGTLRYMSPEQVSQGRLPIDVHTDIYSLGVTLFEMLALRPPFDGEDQLELLRAIAEDEPPRLRILNPHVPADLESIVRKAMAKAPTNRYRSAQELAVDLQRFLDGKPVEIQSDDLNAAKADIRRRVLTVTESAIEMLDRWALLEPSLNEIQQNLLGAALLSIVNLAESETDHHWRLKCADACRRVGEVQRRLGEFDKAQSAIQTAVRLLRTLLSEDREDVPGVKMLARTKIAAGILLCDLEEFEAAKRTLEECLQLCAQPLLHYPVDPGVDDWYSLAIAAHLNLAVLFEGQEERVTHFRAAVALSREFQRRAPQTDATPKLWLALSLYRSGLQFEGLGDDEEAAAYYREVLEIAEQLETTVPRPGWGRLLSQKLMSESSTGVDFDPSVFRDAWREPLYQWSIQAMHQLARHEFVPEYRLFLGIRQLAYGHLLKVLERLDEAEGQLRDAVATFDGLIAEFGLLPEYCDNLAASKSQLADVLCTAGRRSEAVQLWDDAIELRQLLTRRCPQIRRHRENLELEQKRRAELQESHAGPHDAARE